MSHFSRAALLASCNDVGPGARVRGRPEIENFGHLSIGHTFALDASPVSTHLVTARGGALDIGDRVTVGHGVGITAHARVRVGDDVVVGPFAMILDTDFHVVGDRGGAPECTPIEIGNGVTLGAHVTVLRGSRIGDGARVAPRSVVAGHVAAGAHVGGNPARQLRDEGAPADAHRGATADTLPAIVARTLGLAAAPRLTDACAAVPGWDSLGMLNVLLSLEAAFDVELHPDAIARVRHVQDLVDLVTARADRAPLGAAR